MSRDQKKTIERLQSSVEGWQKDAADWREKLYEEREGHKKTTDDLKRTHEVILDATRRDHASLLDDLLLLEPHLKHYQKAPSAFALGASPEWDRERIIRAANHLRGEQALESLGYTDGPISWPDNVTPIGFYHGNPGDLPDGIA